MPIPKTLASPDIIRTRFDRSWGEVARLADAHTMAVQAWLSTRAPTVEYFKGLGVRAGTTGLDAALFNLALGFNYPVDTAPEFIEREIREINAFFSTRNVPWSWWIGPFARPPDFADRITHQGLANERPDLPAMAAPLPAFSPALNPNIKTWPAATRADLKAASFIRRTAFRFPPGKVLTYFEDMADDWLSGDPARLYLARLDDGPPAAIGAWIMGEGIPGVYIMATLPDWGRLGLGKAIMHRLVSEATKAGHDLMILTAGDMGYPLYRQFGFEHLFSYKIFGPGLI